MNCYAHEFDVAVAHCSMGCGRGLCRDCCEEYDRPTCQYCMKQYCDQALVEVAEEITNLQRQMVINGAVLASSLIMSVLLPVAANNIGAQAALGLLMIPVSLIMAVWGWFAFRWLLSAISELTGMEFFVQINQGSCIVAIFGWLLCISFAPIVTAVLLIMNWMQLKRLRELY